MPLTKTTMMNSSCRAEGILIQRTMKSLQHILLIDDDEIFIFLTKKMLQSTGMVESISICQSAYEAIEFLHASEDEWPELILLDLNMPEMSGWDFLQYYQSLIRNKETHSKLFIISSSIADNDKERAKKIKGVDGYLAKPLTTEALKKLLNRSNP